MREARRIGSSVGGTEASLEEEEGSFSERSLKQPQKEGIRKKKGPDGCLEGSF